MFCVSLPGVHISLVICVRGYTYHGGTHITVTPGKFVLLVRTQGFLGYISNMAAVLHGRRVVDLLPVKIVSELFISFAQR